MAIGMRISLFVVGIALVMAWKFLPARATLPAATPDDAASEPDLALAAANASASGSEGSDSPSVTVAPPVTVTLVGGK